RGARLNAARSPDGVPPRHLLQRANAAAQLQNALPGTRLPAGVSRRPLSQSSDKVADRSSCRPGVFPLYRVPKRTTLFWIPRSGRVRFKHWRTRRFAMARAIALRDDFDAAALRQLAKNSKNGPQIRRLLSLAAIYDGATRTGLRRSAGSAFRLSATGYCGSTREALTACWMARRQAGPPNSTLDSARRSPA